MIFFPFEQENNGEFKRDVWNHPSRQRRVKNAISTFMRRVCDATFSRFQTSCLICLVYFRVCGGNEGDMAGFSLKIPGRPAFFCTLHTICLYHGLCLHMNLSITHVQSNDRFPHRGIFVSSPFSAFSGNFFFVHPLTNLLPFVQHCNAVGRRKWFFFSNMSEKNVPPVFDHF